MPNSDPRDMFFFYPTLTLMMESYTVILQYKWCDDETTRLHLVKMFVISRCIAPLLHLGGSTAFKIGKY